MSIDIDLKLLERGDAKCQHCAGPVSLVNVERTVPAAGFGNLTRKVRVVRCPNPSCGRETQFTSST